MRLVKGLAVLDQPHNDGLGILTEQDLSYINILNECADILHICNFNKQVEDRLNDISDYITKYAYPEGFQQRLTQWDEKLEELYTENK
jgi:hypothetical protein